MIQRRTVCDTENTFKFEIELDESLPTHREIIKTLDAGRLYEKETTFIADNIGPEDVFFDIGANIGWFSLMVSGIANKRICVHAFEPEFGSYQRLLRNISINNCSLITPYNWAVGAEERMIDLHINADNDGGHALWPVARHSLCEKTRARGPLSQKSWCTDAGKLFDHEDKRDLVNPHRNWVKIDTEGCEFLILSRMLGLCGTVGVNLPVVIAEINRFGLQNMGSDEQTLRGYMERCSYTAWRYEGFELIEVKIDDKTPDNKFVFNMIFTPQGFEVKR